MTGRAKIPKSITPEQEIAYLRALAETGNGTLAAEWAGVSRSWTYKKRGEDAAFNALCRRMVAAAGERLKEEARWAPNPLPTAEPPHPARAARESTLSPQGRGARSELVVQLGERARVRRARAGEWTAERERRFLGALAATKDVRIAVASSGTSLTGAYRRRDTRPGFAQGWREALACDDWEVLAWWPQCIAAMLDGIEQEPENPVRITGIGDVIRMYERDLGVKRGRPMR